VLRRFEEKRMHPITRLALALSFCAGCALVACSSAKEIENEIDCQGICQRYSDCFDSSYDVSGCQDRCENSVDRGDLTFEKVDSCNDCIDDRSCAGGTLNCATECVGIVP
jgi:hypothetical protein